MKKYGSEDAKKAVSTFLPKEVGMSEDGNKEIIELFGQKIFSFPKPSSLIQHFLKSIHESDYTVLDFFAGSGSTAQAVLSLNKEDGGNRKFILVQLPELCDEKSEAFKAGYKTISEVSRERIRRVISKIQDEQKNKPNIFENTNQDLGFKSFKLSPSNFKIWRGSEINEENLVQQLDAFTNPVREGSEKDNMLYELMLKAGYLLTDKVEKIENLYSIKNGELLIAIESINQATVDKMITLRPKKVISLDILFKGNDQLEASTVLKKKDAGIGVKTIGDKQNVKRNQKHI